MKKFHFTLQSLKKYNDQVLDSEKSILGRLRAELAEMQSELDAKVIEDAARAGDIAAAETYQITGNILGRCLADFIHFSRPSSIFLFGGPVKSGDLLLVPTRESMEKNLMPVFRNKVKF